MRIKKYYYPFTRSIHTPDKLMEEYTLNTSEDENYDLIIGYLNSLDDFDRVVFLLYCEYNSYRLVAEETNVYYVTIYKIINNIRNDIKILIEKNKKEK